MTKEIEKIQVVYSDGSVKEISKGMVCDVSTEDANAEFLNCEVETDIKPLLKVMIATLEDLDGSHG